MKITAQITAISLGCCLAANSQASDFSVFNQGMDGSSQHKVAYVEVNDHDIADVGCFMEHGKPLFDMAIIFAANINANPIDDSASLHLNRQSIQPQLFATSLARCQRE